jgi:hypothetical protein
LNFTNRTQIAIHLSQVHEARLSRVNVRVVKPGNHSSTFQIYLIRSARGQLLHLFICANGNKAAAGDRHCFGPRQAIVNGDDVAIVQNQLRLSAL